MKAKVAFLYGPKDLRVEELEVPKEACHLTTADAKGRCRSGSAEPPGSLPPLPRSLYWRDDDVLEAEGAWKGAEGHSVICRNLLYFVLTLFVLNDFMCCRYSIPKILH